MSRTSRVRPPVKGPRLTMKARQMLLFARRCHGFAKLSSLHAGFFTILEGEIATAAYLVERGLLVAVSKKESGHELSCRITAAGLEASE